MSAIALLKAHPLRRPACCRESSQSVQLRQAYSALGEAYMAEAQHVDRDCSQALKVRCRPLLDRSSKPLQCSAPDAPQHVPCSCMRGPCKEALPL